MSHQLIGWRETAATIHAAIQLEISSRAARPQSYGHLWVNGAKIGISAGGARCDGEYLVGVERGGFLKLLLDAHHRVWFFVPVNPGYFFPRLHRQSLRSEVEILNHYLVLFGSVCAIDILHLTSDCEKSQIKEADAAKQRRSFIFLSKSSHN